MTHTQVLQIALIVGALFFFLGTIFGLLVLAYGENGLFAIRNELDSEVEQGVKLLKENETLKWKLSTLPMFKAYSPLYLEPGKTYALEYDEDIDPQTASFIIENCEQRTGAKFLLFVGGLKVARKTIKEGLSESEVAAEFSTEGAGSGAIGNPGHVDDRPASSLWVCAKRGHRFFPMVRDGVAIEVCDRCLMTKEPA